jgi:hypothetical protein
MESKVFRQAKPAYAPNVVGRLRRAKVELQGIFNSSADYLLTLDRKASMKTVHRIAHCIVE